MTYDLAKSVLYKFVNEEPLHLQHFDRAELEERAERSRGLARSLEQKCVNYLRHNASVHDELAYRLHRPDKWNLTESERHVLHLEKRRLLARLKERILDEIAHNYPWLRPECFRQKMRDGVEEDPGEFVLPFGPFKGRKLQELETDYLIRLLGEGSVQKSHRTRIERHVAERIAAACNPGPH